MTKASRKRNNRNRMPLALRLPQTISRPSGFPVRLRQRLRYNENSISGGTGTTDVQYSLNSIFEPTPGGGHQPLAHDQWATFFTRYVVLGVHFHVEYCPTFATAVPAVHHIAVCPTQTNTAIGEVSTAAEQTHGSKTQLCVSTSLPAIFDKYVRLRDVYGVDDEVIRTDDTYSATFAASPTKIARLHILCSQNGVAAFTGVLSVTISYDCEFFSPIQLTQS